MLKYVLNLCLKEPQKLCLSPQIETNLFYSFFQEEYIAMLVVERWDEIPENITFFFFWLFV